MGECRLAKPGKYSCCYFQKEELTGFKLRDYKDEKGSDKLGGHDFDITTMTEIERWRHEDK